MSLDRFYLMVGQVSRFDGFWNESLGELNIELFENELNVMSSGEVYLAQFFASVWFGNNTLYGFDFADSVATLDAGGRAIIAEWLVDPFWP